MFALIPFPYKLIAVGVVAAGLFGGGYLKGHQHAAALTAQATMVAQAKVIGAERAQQALTASIVATQAGQQEQSRTIYKTIEKEVIRYVQTAAPACRLDAGWVRLHDAAALSAVPGAPSVADASATAFTSTDGLVTVTGNYEACNSYIQELTALQGWVRQQQELFDSEGR